MKVLHYETKNCFMEIQWSPLGVTMKAFISVIRIQEQFLLFHQVDIFIEVPHLCFSIYHVILLLVTISQVFCQSVTGRANLILKLSTVTVVLPEGKTEKKKKRQHEAKCRKWRSDRRAGGRLQRIVQRKLIRLRRGSFRVECSTKLCQRKVFTKSTHLVHATVCASTWQIGMCSTQRQRMLSKAKT